MVRHSKAKKLTKKKKRMAACATALAALVSTVLNTQKTPEPKHTSRLVFVSPVLGPIKDRSKTGLDRKKTGPAVLVFPIFFVRPEKDRSSRTDKDRVRPVQDGSSIAPIFS